MSKSRDRHVRHGLPKAVSCCNFSLRPWLFRFAPDMRQQTLQALQSSSSGMNSIRQWYTQTLQHDRAIETVRPGTPKHPHLYVTYIHAHIHTFSYSVHTCIHTCTYIYTHIYVCKLVLTCICTCVYIYMYVFIHTHT